MIWLCLSVLFGLLYDLGCPLGFHWHAAAAAATDEVTAAIVRLKMSFK
jgi:hypothetical protein